MVNSKKRISKYIYIFVFLICCILVAFFVTTVGGLVKTAITNQPSAAAHTDHSIDGVCGTTHMTCIKDPIHGKCGSPVPNQNCVYPTFMDNFISNGAGIPFDEPPDDDKGRWSCRGSRGGKTNQCEAGSPVTPTPTPTPTPTTPPLPAPTTRVIPGECGQPLYFGHYTWCALIEALNKAFKIFLYVFAPIATLMLIWGGIVYITSNGKEEKTKQAKKIILYTVIGIVIVTAIWGLITLAANAIPK